MKLFSTDVIAQAARRFSQSLLYRPACTKSFAQHIGTYTQRTRPFSHRHLLAAVDYNPICPSIVGLCPTRRPDAILLAVVTIVVFALNSVFRRCPWSHISIKLFKVVPFNLDPASPVLMITSIPCVLATPIHRFPDYEFTQFRTAMRTATSSSGLSTPTPTALAISLLQVCASNNTDRSASTLAIPTRRWGHIGKTKNRPTVKRLSGEIFELWISRNNVVCRHIAHLHCAVLRAVDRVTSVSGSFLLYPIISVS